MGVRWVAHYMDNIITMGATGSEECASNFLLMHLMHIKGAHNVRADALSSHNLSLFHLLRPQAKQEGAPVLQSLLDLLILSKPDWTSKRWTELWTATFKTD